MSNKGATIIELMTSIVIITIVSFILYNSYQYGVKNSSETVLKIEAKNLLSDYLESEKLSLLDTTASELIVSRPFRGDSLLIKVIPVDSTTTVTIMYRDSVEVISISYPSLPKKESEDW